MLVEFGPEIWIADGPHIVAAAGFHYPTRMTVIRLPDGDLILWSPVAVSDALRSEVDRLGTVRHLVAPNTLHDTHIGDWQAAYRDALLHVPRRLAEKRGDIVPHGYIDEGPIPAGWAADIDLVTIGGNRITTETVLFHKGSGTAVFTDLIQQFPASWFTGWRRLVARLDLMVAAEPSVPRKFRLAFSDRPAARAALDRILEWPVQKVLFAHGDPVTRDGKAFLLRAFGWLTG